MSLFTGPCYDTQRATIRLRLYWGHRGHRGLGLLRGLLGPMQLKRGIGLAGAAGGLVDKTVVGAVAVGATDGGLDGLRQEGAARADLGRHIRGGALVERDRFVERGHQLVADGDGDVDKCSVGSRGEGKLCVLGDKADGFGLVDQELATMLAGGYLDRFY